MATAHANKLAVHAYTLRNEVLRAVHACTGR